METYRKFFDIDPDFFPAVNSEVIEKDPDLWKKYYPHETFIKLLKQTINVLERKQKLNIWVEGAYGTGKSHAVLTLKRLLDANTEDTNSYFKQFKLDDDLRKKFIAVKEEGKIITVHRYGSSSIYSDNDLFLAMQESIEDALKAAGINNAGPNALKDGIIKYLSDEENKRSFEVYVTGSYKESFGGETVDQIIEHLSEYTGEALQSLMNAIFKLANEKNIKAFKLDDVTMIQWITEVIQANNLKAIVFIWDEFTEYFDNNAHRLTGFQRILDLSQTQPFCFIPVTHKSDAGMDDADQDKKKILGRFVHPTCIIELPENMAFQLIGAAMQIKDDEFVKEEWEDIKNEIELRTYNSRKRIKDYAGIEDIQLRNILPIHPYTACLLKHISASFASNQRSMFDFIKNGGDMDQKGFQWYIDKFGPLDDNPFLTIDMLWGYFYENGKNDLSQSIRQILDRYNNLSKQLDDEEKKVLKTILLFQAISHSAGDTIDIFLPNEKNINFAFEGTDFENGQAVQCAEKLIRDKIIYKRPLKDGTFLYSILTGELDADQIEKKKAEYENRTTSSLIKEGLLDDAITLPHDLKLRYKISYAGPTDFDQVAKKAINESESDLLHFYLVVCLSKSTSESITMAKKIKQIKELSPKSEVIFVDCGKSPLGEDNFEKWVENMATSSYYTGKDNNQATQYNNYAKAILSKWRLKISQGEFVLYSTKYISGENIHNIDLLGEELRNIDRGRYPLAIECNYKSIANWWEANSLSVGVECGITGNLKSTYANKSADLKNTLSIVWNEEEYWIKHPSEPISRIKTKLEELIQEKLKTDGRISILTIYNFLSMGEFGFLPCNLTAVFIGALLKNYVDDKFSWSDEISSDNMTVDKMKEMISEVINLANTPNPRYRNKYIVTMTPEEKAFIEGTSEAFNIQKVHCSSVESARDRIRSKMKDYLYFPIWTINEIIDEISIKTDKTVICSLIESYQELANNTTSKTDTDIANEIGRIFIKNKCSSSDLKAILTPEYCKKGMLKYLKSYSDGELVALAEKINDGGQYINELKLKFDAGEANWVWKKQTVDQQIDILITEYKIASVTSDLLGNVTSYKAALQSWKEKCSNIKIAYETFKNYVGELQPLLNILKELKINGLAENKKESFLDLLVDEGANFNAFYTNQLETFKLSCSFYLQELSDSDVEKIFKLLPGNAFTLDNATFCKKLEDSISEYKTELGSSKLKELWKSKTNTDSPKQWSNQYKMPILIVIPDEDQAECRNVFTTLNSSNPTDKEINKALTCLESFKYWDKLDSKEYRDKAFKEKILGETSIMIQDLEEIKTYLANHISDTPYYWLGNSQVAKCIQDYAQAKYNSDGYTKAMDKIDSMNPEDVKKYLKELIKNNMNVGIQIIKNN